MQPEQSAMSFGKDKPSEKARLDFPEPHAHPCRRDPGTGAVLYYHGFAGQGHTVRRWNGDGWGEPFTVSSATIRRSVRAELPPGATVPEGPKK